MLPKSRRALTIQEIAALARSSLHGISQVVKDHVTKPTAMAQGRVAHLIEWKGWCKPTDSPAALESDFNSYSDLTEGEQEARFAAEVLLSNSSVLLHCLLFHLCCGLSSPCTWRANATQVPKANRHSSVTSVAEQFAIAEAKLRAWSSIDGEDSNDDSYDEDFGPASEPSQTIQNSDTVSSYPSYLRDFLHSHVCQQRSSRQGSSEQENSDTSPTVSPDTLCSSLCSLEDHPLLKDLGSSPVDLAAKILGALQGGEELLSRLQRGRESAFRSLGHLVCEDSSYSVSYTESCFSPEDEEDLACKDYDSVCKDECDYPGRRKVSDVASSGVVSLDEEEEEEQEEGEEGNQ
ncbi:F131A protein, partial [Atractosteus spatula]|nr:F131A protein [Atractosteus spatula]